MHIWGARISIPIGKPAVARSPLRHLPVQTMRLSLRLLILVAIPFPVNALPANTFSAIEISLASGNIDDAVARTNAGLSEHGLGSADRAHLLLDRALARLLLENGEAALPDISQAIKSGRLTKSQLVQAYFARAQILSTMDRLDGALADYDAIFKIAPDATVAAVKRADILLSQNRLADARHAYQSALSVGKFGPEGAFYGLGQIAEREGKPAEARQFYSQAVLANKNYAPAISRLAAIRNMPDASPLRLRSSLLSDESGARSGARFGDTIHQEVQLGAWRSQAEAAEGWERAVKSAGRLLSQSPHRIVVVDLSGKGTYYRLRAFTKNSKTLCEDLVARSVSCIPARD